MGRRYILGSLGQINKKQKIMVATFGQQFRTIFRKNVIIHFRSRALFREMLNLAIVLAVVIVIDKVSNQPSSKNQIPFYMSIAIMLFCRGVAINWVGERQSRQSQVQKIMGTSNAAYYSGWLVFSLLNGLFISAVFIGILAATGLLSGTGAGFGQVFGLYFLFLVASFSFVLFLCSFFTDALFASQIITFIQLLSSMLYFLLYVNGFRQSQIAMQITAILPSIGFQFTLMAMGFDSTGSLFDTPFTTTEGFITLGVVTVGYFVLFVYLSLVLPNENGNNLHPLFFLNCCKSTKSESEIQKTFQLANMSSARYYQQTKEEKKISMYLKNLTKTFDEKVIVDKLSLSLFQGEIFCLLGHNGAGKSTTINILTGILQPDSGVINIFGYDYYNEMTLIRNKTGVCLQIDVLYDDLTVREQLQFFANIKGIPAERLEMTVNEMINRCGLADEQYKRTKQLSGGNKRKTCLACASIGDSQLLFLDQPSSGLDPNSRRVIWGLIDSLRKEGRTIVLTTHHLEEAEALANRIGILAHGEMLVQGSCHYIKQRFGCGYYLEIALNSQINLEGQRTVIRNKIRQLIAGFREDQQVNDNSLRFLLPNNQQEYYSTLFAFLEEQQFKFSLKLSSLEDIFIKIGMDAQSILSNEPLPQLQKVAIPEYEPVYNMSTQIKHVFIKKFKTTIRSPSIFFSIMLPIIFIVIGVIIALEAFPVVPNDQKTTIINTWSRYYTWSTFMCLAFAFNTASYCGSLVKEREISFKYLSYVMGMKKPAYWIGTILFDLLQFCLPFSIIFLVIGCFPSDQNAAFVASFGWLALTLIVFSFSFLPFTYLWSFAFDKAASAFRFYPFLVYFGFFVIPEIPMFFWPDSPAIIYVLPIVSPLLSLNACMLSKQMLGSENYNLISVISNTYDIQFFTQPAIWYPLIILLAQAIIFFVLVLVLDNLKFNLNDRMDLDSQEKRLQQSEDLIREKAKIRDLKETQPIIVDSLYKKYPNGFVAVRDNSFTVENGQTFGLLGPNGAGKSTTFNILTAAIPKTCGKVMLHGNEVNRAVDQIFTTVGVCPQFNPLYDQLTTAEHIDFFAGIKGLNGIQKQELINFYMSNLQLNEYKDVRSKKLSGGNKRKLCVAMSMVGNPSLIFLDEPSAGVDPIARRYLWNVLHSSSSLKNRSIVLTTHSINQAESLCSRIGILIKGQFYCIGTPRELKQRYGKGYRATVICDSMANLENVKRIIRDNFPNFAEETFPEEMKASFEFPKQNFIFSKAFNLFYNNLLRENIIVQFQISETTLEEVFIYLSRMQVQRDFDPSDQKVSSCCCWQRNSKGCFCLC